MGCGSSNTVTSTAPVAAAENSIDVVTQQVKQTWPEVKKIDKLGEKTFAHLLYKYTEYKPFYHIPEAYKTEADLLDARECQEPALKFLAIYSDIIESSNKKINEVIKGKATELYNKGVRTSQIKNYSDSLVHVIKYELSNMTVEEKHAWQIFCTDIANKLAIEMAKFPRKSIIDR